MSGISVTLPHHHPITGKPILVYEEILPASESTRKFDELRRMREAEKRGVDVDSAAIVPSPVHKSEERLRSSTK
jgi:hypothetical protein